MDVLISKTGNQSTTLERYGVIVQDFLVSSIPVIANYSQVDGVDGTIDNGATYGTREIKVPFTMKAYDLMNFPLTRDEIFNLVVDVKPYYIQEMRRPKKLAYEFVDTTQPARMDPETDNKVVSGKRFLVRISNVIELEQMIEYGEGEIIYETVELPFAESVSTSLNLHFNGISSTADLWGFGMGFESVDEELKYRVDAVAEERFRIFNPSNVLVHPFQQDLLMRISNVEGSENIFQITNMSNGSRARVVVPLSPEDEVVYDGATVKRNNLNFLNSTRKNFVTLSPGWNSFEIYYCDSARIEFDFRFYYK